MHFNMKPLVLTFHLGWAKVESKNFLGDLKKENAQGGALLFWLVGFLTSLLTTGLYRRQASRASDIFVLPHARDRAGRP